MEILQFAALLIFGIAICSGLWGFCFLKIYDEFRVAMGKGSRARLWVAFSFIAFTLFMMIIVGAGIGLSIEQRKLQPVRAGQD